ncbi:Fic family protein [Micromonospora chalcea]
MTDPYCWPGTDCLANKLGLRDAAALRDAEFRLVSIREVQAARTIIPGNYGLGHLQAFHRHLFGDLYKWAGQTRTVDISKPEARFCHWRFIDDQVSTVLTGLSEDGFLLGLRREAFVESLAHYYGELNVCHPFRKATDGPCAPSCASSAPRPATCSTGRNSTRRTTSPLASST